MKLKEKERRNMSVVAWPGGRCVCCFVFCRRDQQTPALPALALLHLLYLLLLSSYPAKSTFLLVAVAVRSRFYTSKPLPAQISHPFPPILAPPSSPDTTANSPRCFLLHPQTVSVISLVFHLSNGNPRPYKRCQDFPCVFSLMIPCLPSPLQPKNSAF